MESPKSDLRSPKLTSELAVTPAPPSPGLSWAPKSPTGPSNSPEFPESMSIAQVGLAASLETPKSIGESRETPRSIGGSLETPKSITASLETPKSIGESLETPKSTAQVGLAASLETPKSIGVFVSPTVLTEATQASPSEALLLNSPELSAASRESPVSSKSPTIPHVPVELPTATAGLASSETSVTDPAPSSPEFATPESAAHASSTSHVPSPVLHETLLADVFMSPVSSDIPSQKSPVTVTPLSLAQLGARSSISSLQPISPKSPLSPLQLKSPTSPVLPRSPQSPKSIAAYPRDSPSSSSHTPRTKPSVYFLHHVSALFYTDPRPIPGALEITPQTIFFESDPRFSRATKCRIIVDTMDLREAGAITLPNEESVGRQRLSSKSNYFLQLSVQSGARHVLLFKVGTRDVLYEITTSLVELIASQRQTSPLSRTSIPQNMASPDIEVVIDSLLCPVERASDATDLQLFLHTEHNVQGAHISHIVSPDMVEAITDALPLSIRFSTWSLAYRPKTHGVSMQTFYRHVAERGSSILLIRDATDRVFGAFASESWAPYGRYFGTGESFVFAFDPLDRDSEKDGEFILYPWSARNEFIQYADEHMFAMGGGGSAIVLDSSFLRGVSQKCETFLSPQLSEEEDFVACDIEVWCFEE